MLSSNHHSIWDIRMWLDLIYTATIIVIYSVVSRSIGGIGQILITEVDGNDMSIRAMVPLLCEDRPGAISVNSG